MKKFIYLLLISLGCTIGALAQDQGYKIDVKFNEGLNGKLFLVANTVKGTTVIAEATLNNGELRFTGKVTETTLAYLMTEKKEILATFMLDNANYSITASGSNLLLKGGGEAQKALNEFTKLNHFATRIKQQFEENLKVATSNKEKESLRQDAQQSLMSVQKQELELIKKYKDSFTAAYIVALSMTRLDEKMLSERYNMLGEKIKTTLLGKQINNLLQKKQKVSIGSIAPDFQAPLSDGGVIVLHETKAKVKIVDFWASWCTPCRQENVNLLKLYKRYQPKGLEIIAVSLDENPQAWLTAIGQDGGLWRNVCDVKNGVSEIANTYCVTSIPSTYILDEENRIVAKNLRGEALEEKIEEMLAKKK